MNNIKESITAQSQKASSSCLFGDSNILLADGRWKEIRYLRSGDVIVDRYLAPQRVIAVNFTYLGERPLYSFNGKKEPLFTPEHQFYTSLKPDSSTSVVSLKLLYDENPQMRGENVEEMGSGNTVALNFDRATGEIQEVKVFVKEHTEYGKETKVYFMLVTGDGSYIADRYVAKHEIPDFTKRPLTNVCMAKVIQVYVKLDDDKKFPVSHSSCTETVGYHAKKIKILWEIIAEIDIYPEGYYLIYFCIIVHILQPFIYVNGRTFFEFYIRGFGCQPRN